jgi:hypothetical protein
MWVNGTKQTITGGTRGSIPANQSSSGFGIGDRGIANNGIPPTFSTNEFFGKIYSVKLFDRALTDEEIAIEYNTMFNNEVQIHESGVLYAKDIKQY